MAPASMGSGQWAVGSGPSVVRGPWVAPHHGDERKAMIESRGCWPDEHIQDRWPSAGLRVVVFGAGQTWVPRASGRLAGWQAGRLHAASAEAALRGATAAVNKNTQCRHYPFQPPRRNAAPSSQLPAPRCTLRIPHYFLWPCRACACCWPGPSTFFFGTQYQSGLRCAELAS
jgi:hypothetical protein